MPLRDAASSYVGQIFQGRYEILDKLGEGGFGTVLKARQIATGQSVALKVLHTEGGGYTREQRIARFQREMRLCAQLHHPNIVRLVDSGQTDAGLLYTVFDLAPGKTLRQVLAEEGRFELREARHLMLQVLDALACAHGSSIVHRDLKPANIMVVPTGARRNALVLDFGIGAISEGAYGEDMVKITATNEALGTPAYSAPEQFRGMPATPRADLYAWGLVFLECITGKRVFSGGSVGEILLQQMSPDPVAMPAELAAHPLGRLLRHATAKDPAARDVMAESLLRALESCDLSGLDPARWAREAASAPEPAEEPAATRLVEGERRQLTAVCCSLAISSAGPEAPDLDEIDDLLRAEQRACVEIAHRFEGHVAGALGDQVLIYFGFPQAREGDARRAARAALAIAEHGRARSARLQAADGLGLEVRVGMHTGLVARALEGAPDATSLVGLTPKIATWLCASVEPGQILVTMDTQRLLRSQFVLSDAGARALEGVQRPLDVFRLEQERPSVELTSLATTTHATPLVGRDEEMSLLRRRWAQARGGAGQRILVTGEPGIGKSRLCHELVWHARDEARIVECRSAPESQNSALRPVVEMLERTLEIGRETPVEERMTKLEALVAQHQLDLAEVMPLFAALLSIPLGRHRPLEAPPQKLKELTLGALVSLFFEMAEQRPLLLLFEDLHWADPTSLELLSRLLVDVSSARVCALATARPEFTPPWPMSGTLQIQVGRLERGLVEQLVLEMTRGKSLPAKVLSQIAGRTDGIPLFVEELTRMILESGALAEGEGQETMAARLDLSIPSTLRGLLTTRLDRLGAPAKETAQVAAALGREFGVEVLRAVSLRSEDAVDEDLEKLVAAELVQRKRRPRGVSYLFRHALLRDTAYESMSKSARREVHTRIAKMLEAHAPDIVEAQPELVAHHYAGAGKYSPAVTWARRAGQRAAQRSADREAEQHYLDGLRWIERIEPSRERDAAELDVRCNLASVLMTTRGFASTELEQVLERTVPLVAELGDSPELFPIRFSRWAFLLNRARHVEALRLAEENLQVAQSSGDPELLMAARMAMGGGSLFVMGRLHEALRYLTEAEPLYDAERFRPRIPAYGHDFGATLKMQTALVLASLGFTDRALRECEAGIARARSAEHVHSVCLALAIRCEVLQVLGDRAGILRTFAELQPLCAAHGVPHWETYGATLAAWASAPDDPEAIGRLHAGLQRYETIGSRVKGGLWRSLLAEACLTGGLFEEGLERVRDGLAFVAETEERLFAPDLLRIRGELRAACGLSAAAEEDFQAALEAARREDDRLRELRAALAFAKLLQRDGRIGAAREILAPPCATFPEGAALGVLHESRALLAALV